MVTVAARGLSVRSVSVDYGEGARRVRAVEEVSLDVAPGEILVLLGASGSGKSSLLRAIAGLEPVADGTVALDGADLADVTVHRRGIGLMFQDGQLFTSRDVGGNVEYGMLTGPRRERPDSRARAARVAELLKTVGLAGYERRPVATLSGGQAQRVALARALAPSPRFVLLDEPLSALDRSLRERLAQDVRAALRSTGTGAIHVTHDLDEAFTIGDRVGVMDAGRLVRLGEPLDLWREPGSDAVADLLGYGPPVGAAAVGGAAGERVRLGPQALRVAAVGGAAVRGDVGDGVALGGDGGREAAAHSPRVVAVAGTTRVRRGQIVLDVELPGGAPGSARVGADVMPADGIPEGAHVELDVDPAQVIRLPVG